MWSINYMNMFKNTVEVSMCCKSGLKEDYKLNPRDHHDPEPIYTCEKCGEECEADLVQMGSPEKQAEVNSFVESELGKPSNTINYNE